MEFRYRNFRDSASLTVTGADVLPAEAEIRRRISARGRISLAEFMDVALYHPGGGYYTSGDRIGASGDYYTSVTADPAFGMLLAIQLFQMWELLGRPSPFTVVECGAGNGLLCRDIVNAAAALPEDFGNRVQYICVDRRASPGCEKKLDRVCRIASERLPLRAVQGCVLSNELVDAMPVHQIVRMGGRLRELYVTLEGEMLSTESGEPSTPLLVERLSSLGVELEEGQTAEVNLGLDPWMADVARALERGFVLTIDYGRSAQDLYSAAQRYRGTLTTFRGHMQTDSPLERIGEQDMSAQVDFTTLAKAGEQEGLVSLGYTSQREFLRNLGLDVLSRSPVDGPAGRAQSNRAGLRELVKGGGLGDFRVMAQGKNVAGGNVWGFHSSAEAAPGAAAIAGQLSLPMPTAEHIDLLKGRYPATAAEFEAAWDTLWPGDATP